MKNLLKSILCGLVGVSLGLFGIFITFYSMDAMQSWLLKPMNIIIPATWIIISIIWIFYSLYLFFMDLKLQKMLGQYY